MDGSQIGTYFSVGVTEGVWGWVSHATTVNVSSAGMHTLQIRRREDGLEIDRIYLTKNADTPTGDGPTASEVNDYTYEWDFENDATPESTD